MVKLNERGRANLNAIMAGFGAEYAAQQGWADYTSVTIRSLPSMDVRSAWGLGSAAAMNAKDAEKNWRELGDGAYLMTVERKGRREHAVVDVVDGVAIDREPINEDQIAALPGLYVLLDEASVIGDGPLAAPAEVVVAVADGSDVPIQ